MISIEKALEKFNKLPAEIILTVDSGAVADKLKELENEYNIKLSALIIFVATGDLEVKGIVKYLKIEFEFNDQKAKQVSEEIVKRIINPLKKRLAFLNANPNKEFSVKDEKDIVIIMFEENLIYELNSHPIIINAINLRIFNILREDLSFKKELENALYKNLEKITHKKFVLDSKTHAPSIRNWIKGFITAQGTGIFNTVFLSNYMANSSNAGILDPFERKSIQRLLTLYRNIKFFPDSMPNDTGEGWEIIPIERARDDAGKAREVSGPPRTEEEKDIDELKDMEEGFKEGGLERMVLGEEIDEKKTIEDMKIMAKKYSADSLERKAIDEEIRKLEVN